MASWKRCDSSCLACPPVASLARTWAGISFQYITWYSATATLLSPTRLVPAIVPIPAAPATANLLIARGLSSASGIGIVSRDGRGSAAGHDWTGTRGKDSQMAFADKTLKCRDCGNSFIFTAGEQDFYQSRGFENEPS